MKRTCTALCSALALAGCGESDMVASGDREFLPPEAPTTGNKWQPDGPVQADGSQCYVLADEECGGTSQADYLQYFEAPIFRTGHVSGTTAYAVDGSNIWVVDVSTPAAPTRRAVVAGAGRALAVAGRGSKLYVAAADQGLLIFAVDPSDPARLTREHQVALPGPAMDLALDADGATAYVAAGSAGLVAVALGDAPAASPPVRTGFAAGVAVAGGLVYVAACGGLDIVDPAARAVTGTLLLRALPAQAPMPAKDVAVHEDLAFVAAGRWGTLYVDISNPRQPKLLGNTTFAEDLLYYANGVTVSHGQVFTAAGDWGVDRVPVDQVRALIRSTTVPTQFPRYCTGAEDPDRQPAPEFRTKLPPPRTQDPLDVVPVGDVLLAMGDASRLGVRAIDVYRITENGAHQIAGRYEEPGRVRSIAAGAGKVALAGKLEGLYVPTSDSRLLERAAALPGDAESTRVVALAGDGRVVSLDNSGGLHLDGEAQLGGEFFAPALPVDGAELVGLREPGGLDFLHLGASGVDYQQTLATPPFRYGAAYTFVGDRLYIASGDWERVQTADITALRNDPLIGHQANLELVPMEQGLLSRAELEDPGAWRQGPPRRLLVRVGEPVAQYVAEIVSFGGRARGLLHPVDSGRAVPFGVPAGPYVGGGVDSGRLWLVQGDRARYRTALVEVDFGDFTGAPKVESRVMLGSAVGAARLGDRLYLADLEAGVRVFQLSAGEITDLGVADLGEVGP